MSYGARPMPGWDDVITAGQRLPGVEVTTSYGTPALKVRDKLICRLRTNPDALVVRVIDMGDREALVRGNPDVFFITPHYDGVPYVLVRLETADAPLIWDEELRSVVVIEDEAAHRQVTQRMKRAGVPVHNDLP